jgi:hypothetical protein
MKLLNILSVVVVLSMLGCNEKNNPVSQTSESSQMAFVVDSLSFQAFDVLGSIHIPVSIVYHFEKVSGSLQTISISIDSLNYDMNMTPSEATPVGLRQLYSREFYTPEYYLGLDSAYVRITFTGTFWERKDSTIITHGSFSRIDSAKIIVL